MTVQATPAERSRANLAETLTALGCAATLADPERLRIARIIDPAPFTVVEHPDHDPALTPLAAAYAERIRQACGKADQIVGAEAVQ